MSCASFDPVVIDAARDGVLDDEMRAHVAACPRCADRLAAQQQVTRALRTLADEDAARGAPEGIETLVHDVWQVSRRAARDAVQPRLAMPAVIQGRPRTRAPRVWMRAGGSGRRQRRIGVASAAAAAGLAAIFVGLLVMASGHDAAPASSALPSKVAAAPAAVDHKTATPAVAARSEATQAHAAPADDRHASGTRTADRLVAARRPAPATARPATREASHGDRAIDAGDQVIGLREDAPGQAPTQAQPQQAVFLALPYAEPLRPTEVPQVVRVAVPTSTVLMAGVRPRVMRDRVLADVLVGEDGVARGIRIVYE